MDNHKEPTSDELAELARCRQEIERLREIEVRYNALIASDYTDEEALRSVRRNEALLNALPDLMFVVQGDGTVLDVRGGHDTSLFRVLNQILGKNVMEILPPNLAQQRMHYIKKALKTGETQRFEYTIEIDNQTKYEESRVIPSGPNEIVNIVRDVSDRKFSEELSQRRIAIDKLISTMSASFLDADSQNIDDVITNTLGKIGNFAAVGRAYLFQISAENYTMSNTHEWCADGVPSYIDNLQNLPLDTFPYLMMHMEQFKVFYAPDVSALPAEAATERSEFESEGIKSIICMPLSYQGKLVGFLGFDAVRTKKIWTDDDMRLLRLTGELIVAALQRHQAEIELRQERALLRSLIDSIPDLIFYKDPEGLYLGCNNAFSQFAGRSEDKLVGRTDFDLFPQDTAEFFREQDQTMMRQGQARSNEENVTYPDGSSHLLDTLKTPFYGPQGALLGLLGISRDITERKQAEQALAKRTAQMAALNEISLAVLGQLDAYSVYKTVTQALVEHFDMSFARIWVLDEAANELVLQVSSGEYTHIDGPHGRVSMDGDRKLALIAQQRTPHISNDLLNDPHMDNKKWVEESKTVAFAGYPLLVSDNLLGVLGMFSHQPIPDETLPLLQSLSALVGTFVNTQNLFTQLEARVQELETVAQVSTAVSTILDAERLLQKVVDLTKEQFGLYHAHIYLLDEANETLVLTTGAGKVGRQMVAQGWSIPLNREQSLVARAARTRQGVTVNNVRVAPDWLPNPLLPDTHAELAVPLLVGDQLLGVLDVQADRADSFTMVDIQIQTILASQIAVALQNARRYEQTQTALAETEMQAERLKILNQIAAALGETTSEADVYKIIAAKTPDIVAAKRASMALINPDGESFEVFALSGIKGIVPTGAVLPLDNTAVGQTVRTNTVTITPATGQSQFLDNQQMHKNGLLSTMNVPIVVSGEVIGAINVGLDVAQAYTQTHANLLQQLASLTASTLQNQRLFKQIEESLAQQQHTSEILGERVKELDCLNDIGREIALNPPIAELLQWLTERIPAAMQRPDICQVAIEHHDQLYGSPDVLRLSTKIVQALRVSGEVVGKVHIAYTQEYPFIDEESALLGGIAGRLGSYLESQELTAQTEKALAEVQQSQELMRSIIDSTPDWIFIKDRSHRYRLVNQGYARSIGIAAEEFIGKNDLELGFPEDIVKGNSEKGIVGFWPVDDEVMEVGETKVIPSEPAEIDGRQLYLSTIKVPLRDKNNEVDSVLGIVRDITDREQLLEQVQRLATIVEHHPDFIGVGTLEGDALYVNPAGLRMMGLPADYDVSQLEAGNFHPSQEARQLLNEGISTALDQGSWTHESQLLKSDGATIPVEETVAINYDSQGQPNSFSITMRDITERKRQDVERERLLTEVEAAYRQYVRKEWEQFLSDAHNGQWRVEHQQQSAAVQPQPIPNGAAKTEVAVPIALRGQQIGRLSLQDVDPNREWTSEELALVETVSEQLAQTVENLRLFDDTQQRAVREQLTREITDKMRAAPDVETIIQTGLTELAQALGVSRSYVKLVSSPHQNNEHP